MSKDIQVFISLGVILICISGAIFDSIRKKRIGNPEDVKNGSLK